MITSLGLLILAVGIIGASLHTESTPLDRLVWVPISWAGIGVVTIGLLAKTIWDFWL